MPCFSRIDTKLCIPILPFVELVLKNLTQPRYWPGVCLNRGFNQNVEFFMCIKSMTVANNFHAYSFHFNDAKTRWHGQKIVYMHKWIVTRTNNFKRNILVFYSSFVVPVIFRLSLPERLSYHFDRMRRCASKWAGWLFLGQVTKLRITLQIKIWNAFLCFNDV